MIINSLFNLNGKTAVVTGANKGIGRSTALLLAEAGADTALVARTSSELEETAEEIRDMGRRAAVFSFDLYETDNIHPLFESIHKTFGSIDILVNNAGINIAKPASEITVEEWDKVLDLNLKSLFFMSQEAGKYMREQKSGKIINMSSQMALVGYYNRSAYSASKGGVSQLTKSLAVEWAADNVHVNAVAPTFIETPMTAPMFEDEAFRQEVLSRIPLGRLAKTEDLHGAVLFLASSSSDMVTGQTIPVDGGWTIW
ncbi:SDR family NAD(P)-dependent oxidoreductase [Salibacterium sp. K-3]